jgi:hypothetical protein
MSIVLVTDQSLLCLVKSDVSETVSISIIKVSTTTLPGKADVAEAVCTCLCY